VESRSFIVWLLRCRKAFPRGKSHILHTACKRQTAESVCGTVHSKEHETVRQVPHVRVTRGRDEVVSLIVALVFSSNRVKLA
jgi:hypothetical protein